MAIKWSIESGFSFFRGDEEFYLHFMCRFGENRLLRRMVKAWSVAKDYGHNNPWLPLFEFSCFPQTICFVSSEFQNDRYLKNLFFIFDIISDIIRACFDLSALSEHLGSKMHVKIF